MGHFRWLAGLNIIIFLGLKREVAQNVLKHALVLEFLKSGKFFFLVKKFKTDRQKRFNRQKSVITQDTAKKKDAQNVMKHALVLEFFKIK